MTAIETGIVCARCVARLPSEDVPVCPECHGRIAASPLPPLDTTPNGLGAEPASDARRALALVIDVALAVAGGAVAALAAAAVPGGAESAVAASVVGLAVAIVFLGVLFVVWVRTARTPGGAVTGTTTVRAIDGTPLGRRGIVDALSGRGPRPSTAGHDRGPVERLLGTITLDRRLGADPARLLARAVPALPAAPPSLGVASPSTRLDAVTLVYEQRDRIRLEHAVVLGRTPRVDPPEPGVVAVALPDLSRRLSRDHVRVELDRGRIFATDLGSMNGTELVVGTRIEPLHTGRRTEVPAGAHLLLDGRPLRIHARSGRGRD